MSALSLLRAVESLEGRMLLSGSDPVINEFLASNQNTSFLDDYGTRQDWVEIYNPSTSVVNVGGWHLTDSKGNPAKSTFPTGTTIAAGGYLVVFADGRPAVSGAMAVGPGGKLHTNFSLDANGEYLGLTKSDNSVVSEYDPFPAQTADVSYGLGTPVSTSGFSLVASGAAGAPASVLVPAASGDIPANWNAWDFNDEDWPITGQSGIGYDNDSGAGNYNSILNTNLGAQMFGAGRNTSAFVRITFEVSGPKDFTSLKLRMRYDDGFVAYLNGVKIASASAPASPVWNSAATGTVGKNSGFVDIDVTQYLSALRAGKNVLAIQGLNDSSSSPDFLVMPELSGNRITFGVAQYMTTPTPGAANTSGALGRVKDTEFSVDRGFFNSAFDLRTNSDTPGASIRYTTDGSAPTENIGTLYTGPIHIDHTQTIRAVAYKSGYVSSDVDGQTYIFPDQVLQQTGAGLPPSLNWGFDMNGDGIGDPDWNMDPSIVNNPAYSAEIKQDLLSIPSVSLSMPWNDWFNPDGSGLYNSNDNRVDHATSFEIINPDGTKGIGTTAAVQLQGGSSDISWRDDKMSLDVKFQEAFGPNSLDYDVFGPGSGATKSFDHLIMDAMFNKSWTYGGGVFPQNQRGDAEFIVDQYVADLVNAAGNGGVSPHGRFMHLYINGLYWGMYYVHEKPDDHFAAAYYGGSNDDYDVLKHTSTTVVAGTSSNYSTLLNLVRQSQSVPANYQAVLNKLDIVPFIDYMIANFYVGNNDWALHNWYASFNRNDPNAKWHFHEWDAEHSVGGTDDSIAGALSINVVNKNEVGSPTEIHTRLLANADYRALFADEVQRLLLAPNGVMSPTGAAALWLARMNEVKGPLVAESARWGDNRSPGAPFTRDGWLADMNTLLANYFPNRSNTLIGQFRGQATLQGFPKNTNAPLFSNYGGSFGGSTSVTISKPTAPAGGVQAGTIYYTTDGSDPRLSGGGINPAAVSAASSATVNLSASTRVRARILNNTEWSALVDATYVIGAPPALRISEIMYNPAVPAGSAYTADDFEYIELKNTGATAINPSGFSFTNGISFTFAAGSASIPAGGRVVLAKNPTAFATRYPGVSVAGTYTGVLDDGGEGLTFVSKFGQVIESIVYNDNWYGATDGNGWSLTAIDPAASDAVMSTAAGWRASQPANGTPGTGADDSFNYLTDGAVVINEVMAYGTGGGGNWVELKNQTNAGINIGGWWLSHDATNRMEWQIPAGTIISANGYVSFTQNGGFGGAFQLSALGNDLYLTSNDATGGLGGYRDHVDFAGSEANVSFGRYVESTGSTDFVAQSAATQNGANAYPQVGPVVMNEIMYNPLPTGPGLEYLELRNITDAPVPLAGWSVSDGISFTFGAGASIAADGYALIVPIDPAQFRNQYGIPAEVAIFGPYAGQLSNGGEKLTLAQPGVTIGTTTGTVVVDRVNYDNQIPWPAAAAGTGPSLGRINAVKYGNDPINWRADTVDGTAGAANANPPLVFVSTFAYSSQPTVSIKFSKDVGASLANADLSIQNLTSGQAMPQQQIIFNYDANTQTATWQLPATLADGNYRAVLSAAGVSDAQGRPLDGNGDGTGGDDLTLDFFHLGGDTNHDRSVNFTDLVTVAQNYGTSGKTFAQGDFNFDGSVDFADLVILAQRYNVTLPPPAPAVPVSAPSAQALAVSSKPVASAPVASVAGTSSPKVVSQTKSTPLPVIRPLPVRPFGKKRIEKVFSRASRSVDSRRTLDAYQSKQS